MALTQISTGGVKDDAVTAGKIPADAVGQSEIADEAVDEARLQVSNAGSNGQFLSKQSGNTGGLTWATPPDTNTQVGGATGVDFNDDVKVRLGTGNDLEIYHSGDVSRIRNTNDSGTLKIQATSNGENALNIVPNGTVEIYHDGSKKLETTATGVTVTGTVSDSKGDLRSIPRSNQSSAYTLVASDAGKCVTAGGNITVNNSVFAEGNAVTIIADTGSDITITQGSGVTMYNTGDASTGNRTLAARGMCTIWFVAANNCYISGAGLS